MDSSKEINSQTKKDPLSQMRDNPNDHDLWLQLTKQCLEKVLTTRSRKDNILADLLAIHAQSRTCLKPHPKY